MGLWWTGWHAAQSPSRTKSAFLSCGESWWPKASSWVLLWGSLAFSWRWTPAWGFTEATDTHTDDLWRLGYKPAPRPRSAQLCWPFQLQGCCRTDRGPHFDGRFNSHLCPTLLPPAPHMWAFFRKFQPTHPLSCRTQPATGFCRKAWF